MKVYHLKNSIEKKEIGSKYPQIETMRTQDHDKSRSVYALGGRTFPELPPILDSFILNDKSKLTDVLSAAMIDFGFLVNEKAKGILSKHKLPDHRFFSASVLHKNILHSNYFWFYYISDVWDYIDYSKTHFFISDMVDNHIEDYNSTKSADSLKLLNKNLPFDRKLNSNIIHFSPSLLKNFDLFELSFSSYNAYISESLYNDLLANKVTGFDYILSQKIIIE